MKHESKGILFRLGPLAAALAFGLAAAPNAQASERRATCAGLHESETGSFFAGHAARIDGVEPLKKQVRVGKHTIERTAGARVAIRAQPGLNVPYLQRLADCGVPADLQRAAGQQNAPEVSTRVHEAQHHFLVDIEAESSKEGAAVESYTRQAVGQLGARQ